MGIVACFLEVPAKVGLQVVQVQLYIDLTATVQQLLPHEIDFVFVELIGVMDVAPAVEHFFC